MAARYRVGDIGYREAKDRLVDTLELEFRTPHARYDDLMYDVQQIDAVLGRGAERSASRALVRCSTGARGRRTGA